jgi:hypothetical protein
MIKDGFPLAFYYKVYFRVAFHDGCSVEGYFRPAQYDSQAGRDLLEIVAEAQGCFNIPYITGKTDDIRLQ